MLARHSSLLDWSLRALDLGILAVTPYLARGLWDAGATGSARDPLPFALVLAAAWLLLSYQFSIYRSRRTDSLPRELLVIGEVLALSVGVASAFSFSFLPQVPLDVPPVLAVAASLFLLSRIALRKTLRFARQRRLNYKRVLFVGQGRTAMRLADSIHASPHFGLQSVGYLTFTGEDGRDELAGLKCLGTVDDAVQVVKAHAIDDMIVCPSLSASTGQIQQVLDICETVGVTCRLAPDFLSSRLSQPIVSWLGDQPTYTFSPVPHDSVRLAVKRVIDVVGAGIGLIVLAPGFLACALAIKLSSRGPVFYAQERCGRRGVLFTFYKFRSMEVDADRRIDDLREQNEQRGPVFKMRNDPRITAVGRFLRRYSLDELPQLFNVLKGDMSLVGPRPPIPSEVERYEFWQRRRLSVKPGLTCIWQVSGRNSISFERWMELDMEYIDRWSLRLDFKLIAKTFGAVIKGSGM